MNYKGYEAIVEYDHVDNLFVGRVINTRDVIAFDGLSVDELEASFFAAVDEYLDDCDRLGKDPDKPFSGRFNLRIPPELHRRVVGCAEKEGLSLNAFVEKALAQFVAVPSRHKAVSVAQTSRRSSQATATRKAATDKTLRKEPRRRTTTAR